MTALSSLAIRDQQEFRDAIDSGLIDIDPLTLSVIRDQPKRHSFRLRENNRQVYGRTVNCSWATSNEAADAGIARRRIEPSDPWRPHRRCRMPGIELPPRSSQVARLLRDQKPPQLETEGAIRPAAADAAYEQAFNDLVKADARAASDQELMQKQQSRS